MIRYSYFAVITAVLLLLPPFISGEAESNNDRGYDKYYISVGSFLNAQNAEMFTRELEKNGLPAFKETISVRGKLYTRVILHKEYSSRLEAMKEIKRLSANTVIRDSGAGRLWIKKGLLTRSGETPGQGFGRFKIIDEMSDGTASEYTDTETPPVKIDTGMWTAETIIDGYRTLSTIYIQATPKGDYILIYPSKDIEALATVCRPDKFIAAVHKDINRLTGFIDDLRLDQIKMDKDSTVFTGRVINPGLIVIDEIWENGEKADHGSESIIRFIKR